MSGGVGGWRGAIPVTRPDRGRPPHMTPQNAGYLSQADTPLSRHLAPAGSFFQTGLFFPSYRQFLSAHLSSGLAMHWLAFPEPAGLRRPAAIDRSEEANVGQRG